MWTDISSLFCVSRAVLVPLGFRGRVSNSTHAVLPGQLSFKRISFFGAKVQEVFYGEHGKFFLPGIFGASSHLSRMSGGLFTRCWCLSDSSCSGQRHRYRGAVLGASPAAHRLAGCFGRVRSVQPHTGLEPSSWMSKKKHNPESQTSGTNGGWLPDQRYAVHSDRSGHGTDSDAE